MLRKLFGEFVKYGLVSGLALAIDVATLALLVRFGGMHYAAAAAISFALGAATAYVLSVRYVFAARSVGDMRVELALFIGIGIAGAGINSAVMYVGVEKLRLYYLYAKPLAAVLTFGFNFAARKFFLFSRSNPAAPVAVEPLRSYE